MGNYVWKAKGKPPSVYFASDTENNELTDDEEEYESCFDSESLFSNEILTAVNEVQTESSADHFYKDPPPSNVNHLFKLQEFALTEEQLSEKVTIDEFLCSEFDEYTQSEDITDDEDAFSLVESEIMAAGHAAVKNLPHPVCDESGPGGDAAHKKLMSVNEFIKSENAEEQAEGKNPSVAWEINFESQSQVPEDKSEAIKRRLQTKKPLTKKRKQFQRTMVNITMSDISSRKVLDVKRLYCMCRPQYKKSCGISSVVSVWNYLFSTLGTGLLDPITQENALDILGFEQPFDEIRFGPFTGNTTLMRWFRKLNEFFGVRGKAFYLYKPKGRIQTKLMTDVSALEHLKQGLGSKDTAFIYHCYNHYFCPIGFESTPQKPGEAYDSKESIINSKVADQFNDIPSTPALNDWIFIGEPSQRHPPIHCRRWDEILQDLHMESPQFYDIRKPEKGVQHRKTKKKGGNLHCLIAFKKINMNDQAKCSNNI